MDYGDRPIFPRSYGIRALGFTGIRGVTHKGK